MILFTVEVKFYNVVKIICNMPLRENNPPYIVIVNVYLHKKKQFGRSSNLKITKKIKIANFLGKA